MQSTKLPAPEAADSKEVALALEEAIALGATGKGEDALRAVSRAADAAERAGATERAAALRAAASDPGTAASRTPSPAVTGRPPPPSAKHSTVPQSPASRAPTAVASHAPPPPSARATSKAPSVPPPSVTAQPASSPPAAQPASSPPAALPTSSPPAALPVPAMSVDASFAQATTAQGLHVWVRTSARDPTLLLVRLLPDGHPAPPGSYEAFLRPAEEGADLLAPKH